MIAMDEKRQGKVDMTVDLFVHLTIAERVAAPPRRPLPGATTNPWAVATLLSAPSAPRHRVTESLTARPESDVMATLAVNRNDLVVRLSALEKIGALRGNIRVPLASVRAVRVSDTPWSELRGIRAPGTGLPGVISLCTRRGPGVHDFAAVYGRRPAIVVEMTGASFDRLSSPAPMRPRQQRTRRTSRESPDWRRPGAEAHRLARI